MRSESPTGHGGPWGRTSPKTRTCRRRGVLVVVRMECRRPVARGRGGPFMPLWIDWRSGALKLKLAKDNQGRGARGWINPYPNGGWRYGSDVWRKVDGLGWPGYG